MSVSVILYKFNRVMSEQVAPFVLSDTFCLLQWIHTFPNSNSITNLQDIIHSPLVVDILKGLDLELYKQLSSDCLEGVSFAFQLTKYILKYISSSVIITKNYTNQQLISKLLYICVHGTKKQQFIQKIMTLDGETQGTLMKIIEKIENQLLVVKQNKLILCKIADLQCENEQFQYQLNQQKALLEKQKILLQETKTQLKQLQQECDKYRREKAQTMRELEIDQFGSYVSMYKKIQEENNEFLNNIKEFENKILKIQQNNKELKLKILEDGMIISKYQQDSNQLKLNLRKLRFLKQKTLPFYDKQIKNDNFSCESYSEIINELEEHMLQQKEKHSKMVAQQLEQIKKLTKQNHGLRKATKYLSGQIGQLQKVYKIMKECVTA